MRFLLEILDAVMQFAYPHAECTWRNRGMFLVLVGFVAGIVWAVSEREY